MRLRPTVALAFLLPALLLYSVLVIYPSLRGLTLSLTNSDGVSAGTFVGLANYERMFSDTRALASLRNTVVYALLVTAVQTVLGVGLALWLGRLPRLRNPLRVAIFTPGMLAPLIVAFVWSYIYYPLGGGLNALLDAVGLGKFGRPWLGDATTALPAVVIVHAWMYAGHSAAIFLANYLTIPPEIVESAELDGASGWARFRHIEWPLLAPATTINTVLTMIGALKVFELPFVLTGGGPGDASRVINLEIYGQAFSGSNFGYAAALSVALLVLIVIVTALQTIVLRAREMRL